MYGLIHNALRGMILEQFGETKWNDVLTHSGVPADAFVTMRSYDDEIMYALAGSASDVLGAPVEDCMDMFGRYWVLKAAPETYSDLLDYTGRDPLTFFENLNDLHDRITAAFVGYRPPYFYVDRTHNDTMTLRYVSERHGLTPFVVGLIKGIAERFSTPIEILNANTTRDDTGETTIFELRLG